MHIRYLKTTHATRKLMQVLNGPVPEERKTQIDQKLSTILFTYPCGVYFVAPMLCLPCAFDYNSAYMQLSFLQQNKKNHANPKKAPVVYILYY